MYTIILYYYCILLTAYNMCLTFMHRMDNTVKTFLRACCCCTVILRPFISTVLYCMTCRLILFEIAIMNLTYTRRQLYLFLNLPLSRFSSKIYYSELCLCFGVPAWRSMNGSVQYNGGFLPDITLLTQCDYHRGTHSNTMDDFCPYSSQCFQLI